MKQTLFALSLVMTLLSACVAVPANTEVPTLPVTPPQDATATEAVPAPTDVAPSPTLPALSFEPQTYVNEAVGFALDYPVGWTTSGGVIGDRGSQVKFLSSPELAEMETLPEGATRVNATVYQWDPKSDLAAYSANRKGAWDASGFTIMEEQQLVLDSGLPAVQFTVQTPDTLVIFVFTAIGDQYLEVSGEGNLDLVKEIAHTLRPVSK